MHTFKYTGRAGNAGPRAAPPRFRELAADLAARKAAHATQAARLAALRDRRRGIARPPRFLALLEG